MNLLHSANWVNVAINALILLGCLLSIFKKHDVLNNRIIELTQALQLATSPGSEDGTKISKTELAVIIAKLEQLILDLKAQKDKL